MYTKWYKHPKLVIFYNNSTSLQFYDYEKFYIIVPSFHFVPEFLLFTFSRTALFRLLSELSKGRCSINCYFFYELWQPTYILIYWVSSQYSPFVTINKNQEVTNISVILCFCPLSPILGSIYISDQNSIGNDIFCKFCKLD